MTFSVSDPLPRMVVLYGGVGPERGISVISGQAILRCMANAFPYPHAGIELHEATLPDGLDRSRDVVLLALHGEFGEDGQVQRLLESAGIHYAGCDATSSALCMDKAATKQCWQQAGLPVVEGRVLHAHERAQWDAQTLSRELGTELIAKPVAMGSSVGLQPLSGVESLDEWCRDPVVGSHSWLIERRIRGREFSVGILNGQALGVVEITVPDGRIYDYEQKYQRTDTEYVCPADLNGAHTHRVRRLAEQAYVACGCRDYARVDFLYETDQDRFLALELNTLPGMTPQSLLPKSALAVGYSFEELLRQMVAPAVERFREQASVGHVAAKQHEDG